ncbi:histidine phosphatase family protein [Desulfocurvus sp. DL9XJH121]
MIVLIRHAQAEGGRGRYIGSTDLPLSALGREQAADLAANLRDAGIRTLASSPLLRARDTAAPLAAALGLPAVVMEGLAEIHLGDWEGRVQGDILREQPDAHAARGRDLAGFRPPNGESFADLFARADAAMRELLAMPQPVAAVTHAGVIRVLVRAARALPWNDLFTLRPDHACCTAFHTADGAFRLGAYNSPPAKAKSEIFL